MRKIYDLNNSGASADFRCKKARNHGDCRDSVMEKTTVGTVISVKKQWWLKVNTKPVRMHALDGATFPHIITVKYSVNGQEYTRRKWIKACDTPPALNSEVTVMYDEYKPSKSKVL